MIYTYWKAKPFASVQQQQFINFQKYHSLNASANTNNIQY